MLRTAASASSRAKFWITWFLVPFASDTTQPVKPICPRNTSVSNHLLPTAGTSLRSV